jgi:hypothetical protein
VRALEIDERIVEAWVGHPARHVIEPTTDFVDKAQRALAILNSHLPRYCAQ